ncbi:MAG: site-specific DNA-methyltransferase [Chlorobium sp.]
MDRFLNKITCGDNCDLLGLLPRECIDLVVTSPPYDDLRTYGGHTWDFYGVAWQLKRVLKPGGVIVWVVADATKDGTESGTSMEQALFFKRLGLNLHDTMIYSKGAQGGAKGSNYCYTQSFEYMFVFSKGKPNAINLIADRKNTEYVGESVKKSTMRKAGGNMVAFEAKTNEVGKRTNVWEIRGGFMVSSADTYSFEHPATFPESLPKDHILSWSNVGDIVLDPFSGSGTTAKAAKELERQYIGFEINPAYCNIGEARTAQEVLSFATV